MGAITPGPARRFFARTLKPFFLFTGAGTALVVLYAFDPAWVGESDGWSPVASDPPDSGPDATTKVAMTSKPAN